MIRNWLTKVWRLGTRASWRPRRAGGIMKSESQGLKKQGSQGQETDVPAPTIRSGTTVMSQLPQSGRRGANFSLLFVCVLFRPPPIG